MLSLIVYKGGFKCMINIYTQALKQAQRFIS